MRWLLTLVGLVSVLSASSAAPLPKDVEFVPPAIYERWWKRMERCTGLQGKMRSWEFRVNPAWSLGPTDVPGIVIVAETDQGARTITMTAPQLFDSNAVGHEMIHALGIREHRYDVFVTRCKVNNDSTFVWQEDPIGMPRKK